MLTCSYHYNLKVCHLVMFTLSFAQADASFLCDFETNVGGCPFQNLGDDDDDWMTVTAETGTIHLDNTLNSGLQPCLDFINPVLICNKFKDGKS